MDTTKTSNPSSEADAADDLIEELARLMADDAQINTPSPVTVPKAAPAAKTESAPAPVGLASNNAPAPKAPKFDLNSFDLGAPKAEISSVQTPVKPPSENKKFGTLGPITKESSAPHSDALAQDQAQEKTNQQDKAPADFDFGFGVGPAVASPETPTESPEVPQAPVVQEPETSSVAETAQNEHAPVDPIADLINAAVSKHDNATKPDEVSTETDSFNTPPVFGLQGTPVKAPTQPDPEESFGGSMALDEIESLIGNSIVVDTPEVVQEPVELTGDISAQMAVEGPPIAPLPTNAPLPVEAKIATLPDDRAGAADVGTHPNSAEAAILQAMAAAGTASSAPSYSGTNDLNEPTIRNEPQLAPGRVAPPQKSKQTLSSYLLPVLGILVVGAIGIGAYFWLNPNQGNADAPILVADGTPTREAPAPTEQVAESVVLNQIDGNSGPVAEESLVSRDETAGATGQTIRQVITADNSEAGLANRRVRTVTVRPDGTIISGEDAVAGGQILPVDQPTLPDLPANAINTTLSNTTVAALPTSPAETVNVETVTVNGSTVPFPKPRLTNREALVTSATLALPSTTGVTPSTATSAVNLISNAATAPVIPVVAVTQPAATVTPEIVSVVDTPTATTQVLNTVSNPQAYVQLASQRSQSTANTTARNLQSRFSSALNGGSLVVKRVDLGTRGIYFRVQLPTDTLRSANSICTAVKNAGGDCFTNSN